jgi:hypothetical protein
MTVDVQLPGSARICVISLRMSLETSGWRVRAIVPSRHVFATILDLKMVDSQ